jgi:glycerol uptake facilitator-like aquaporin
VGGLAIGLAVAVDILMGGPLTGAAMNPARWFGPALVSGEWNVPLLYIFAPLVGGVLAALTYWYLFVEGPPIRAATPETGPKGLRQDVNPPR